MTTPPRMRQERRLVRTVDLATFREALVSLAVFNSTQREGGDPREARRRALILPSRASVELLRQVIEDHALVAGPSACVLPDLLTRDELIQRLYDSQPGLPPLLTRFEREVLLERAADDVRARVAPPFTIRPGLIAAMLDFYDELGRRGRTVRRFAGALFTALRGHRELDDQGSHDLITQTMFLALAFRRYRRGVRAAGALDEHALREHLLSADPVLPFDHIVVAVADRPSDPRGLWPADLDLLGRLRGLGRLDVVVTDEAHDAGFRERIDREVPGLEELRWPAAQTRVTPILVRPGESAAEALVFVSRDREEELRDVVRVIRGRPRGPHGELSERTAIVFQGPLPYLYLAQQTLTEARVPYQAFDALPLGAEPYAAVLDVVLAFARTGGTRETAIDLLRSPLLRFDVDGRVVELTDVAALDAVLTERRTGGEADEYPQEVDRYFGDHARRNGVDADRARRAARAAAEAHTRLQPFRIGETASVRIDAVAGLLRRNGRSSLLAELSGPAESTGPEHAEWRQRHVRARAAVLGALEQLRDAFRRHDDRPRSADDLVAMLHHWVESQTFAPKRGGGGVHLVDAVAARFGRFDHVHIVGLVETDWPERPRRSVFYTTGLLKELGWPLDADQLAAQQAAFRDLLRLPAATVRLHGFQLEGDAVVALSPMAELGRLLPSEDGVVPRVRVFAEELIAWRESGSPEPAVVAALADGSRAWLERRLARPPYTDARYRGHVSPQPPQAYRVSRVDTYLVCPFKYFASNVLRLPEERDEESGLTPLERGMLLHRLFERFYTDWQAAGRGAITVDTLPEAAAMFERLTHEELASLPDGERALESTRLLGSIVGRGVAERVFEREVDADEPVVRRVLEQALNGTYDFPAIGGTRAVDIRGTADRIDVLGDGALRLVDYKLTKLPDLDTAMQLAVYAYCAQRKLEGEDGRPHPVRAAMYLAFGSDRQFDLPLAKGRAAEVPVAVDAAALQFARVVDHIEAGEFLVKPHSTQPCAWCRYAGVCRKEYESDGDAAEPV